MGFLAGDPHDDLEIIESLTSLRERLIPELGTEYIASTPKIVWKLASVYQCLIRRILDATDGMRSAWQADNLLTAITMGWSLIETGAIIQHLRDSIKKAVAEKDVTALDKAIMNVGFGTKLKNLYQQRPGEDYEAQNVLKVIDKMDKRMFKGRKPPMRSTYDHLSEFVHPNSFGILGLYSDSLTEEYRVEFGRTAHKREGILANLRITLAMVWLAEIVATEIDEMVPVITDFVPK